MRWRSREGLRDGGSRSRRRNRIIPSQRDKNIVRRERKAKGKKRINGVHSGGRRTRAL